MSFASYRLPEYSIIKIRSAIIDNVLPVYEKYNGAYRPLEGPYKSHARTAHITFAELNLTRTSLTLHFNERESVERKHECRLYAVPLFVKQRYVLISNAEERDDVSHNRAIRMRDLYAIMGIDLQSVDRVSSAAMLAITTDERKESDPVVPMVTSTDQ